MKHSLRVVTLAVHLNCRPVNYQPEKLTMEAVRTSEMWAYFHEAK
jgi:hypothetical protein